MVGESYSCRPTFSQQLEFKDELGRQSDLFNYCTVLAGDFHLRQFNITYYASISSLTGEYVRGGHFISTETRPERGYTIDDFDDPFGTNRLSGYGVYGGEGAWARSSVNGRSVCRVLRSLRRTECDEFVPFHTALKTTHDGAEWHGKFP